MFDPGINGPCMAFVLHVYSYSYSYNYSYSVRDDSGAVTVLHSDC